MSNRAGKREREARNRHKRTVTSYLAETQSGREWVTVKLGHKKLASHLFNSLGRTGGR